MQNDAECGQPFLAANEICQFQMMDDDASTARKRGGVLTLEGVLLQVFRMQREFARGYPTSLKVHAGNDSDCLWLAVSEIDRSREGLFKLNLV